MAVKEYRSNVFSMLLEEKENALQVFNALNDSKYEDTELVEVLRLENSIIISVRNDASFVIDGQLNIYEHQSTYNPNMPLRGLFYFVDIVKKLVNDKDLYGKKLIQIPTPHFCVFYNGVNERPKEEIFRLSDAFEKKTEQPELELLCRCININPGKNVDFLDKCQVIREYTLFIERVNHNRKNGFDYREAIENAIDECIKDKILVEFLKTRRNEVLEVMTIDMTWERREELIRQEEREEGRAEGREEGRAEGRAEGREEGRAEGRAEGREEGRAEGRAEGREEGRAEGREEGSQEEAERINCLNQQLIQSDRIADLKRSSEDRAFQLELFKEFGL